MNPNLKIHPVYANRNLVIPEYKRIAFSRFRLSSHRLAIETGRWSRIPREERFCKCPEKSVQTEEHVLCQCSLSKPVRDKYKNEIVFTNCSEFFRSNDIQKICAVAYEIIKLYEAS